MAILNISQLKEFRSDTDKIIVDGFREKGCKLPMYSMNSLGAENSPAFPVDFLLKGADSELLNSS
jgi:hypothetical protein